MFYAVLFKRHRFGPWDMDPRINFVSISPKNQTIICFRISDINHIIPCMPFYSTFNFASIQVKLTFTFRDLAKLWTHFSWTEPVNISNPSCFLSTSKDARCQNSQITWRPLKGKWVAYWIMLQPESSHPKEFSSDRWIFCVSWLSLVLNNWNHGALQVPDVSHKLHSSHFSFYTGDKMAKWGFLCNAILS